MDFITMLKDMAAMSTGGKLYFRNVDDDQIFNFNGITTDKEGNIVIDICTWDDPYNLNNND